MRYQARFKVCHDDRRADTRRIVLASIRGAARHYGVDARTVAAVIGSGLVPDDAVVVFTSRCIRVNIDNLGEALRIGGTIPAPDSSENEDTAVAL